MKYFAAILLALTGLAIPTQASSYDLRKDPAVASPERLGTVSFSTSCSRPIQVPFNRGVALLHDFWYEEAHRQFEQIAKTDPGCAMAYWGEAMSEFHQIWNRPDESAMARGWGEVQKAESLMAKTHRERAYISALSTFFKPGEQEYQARVEAYSAAMSRVYTQYPDDVDAGAFYALSLLADEAPNDISLAHQRQALAVLNPLFANNPDHPGVAHYIIHSCDNPSLASMGLEAANRYGDIAPTAPHAAHMPAHIFARLGMWQQDIDSNLASVAASETAEERHQSGAFDQLHADDFLLYAYLQSGQDARAKGILDKAATLLAHFDAMPGMVGHGMAGMLPYYHIKFPVFYYLEMRDWKAASALQPLAQAPPEVQTLTYWARIIAAGHLRQAQEARTNLATYEGLIEQLKKGKHAYFAQSTGARIEHGEVLAWTAFAEGNHDKALTQMRETAELQDKVGQAEVDIPAREMLADMLLALHQPEQALVEFDRALKVSPNRLNGLFNAGMAAEALHDKERAGKYYSALLNLTSNGTQSERVEFAHIKEFLSSSQVALK